MNLQINDQEIVLNIRHDMHEEDWKDLIAAFEVIPGWLGIEKTGAFFWLGKEKDEVYVMGTITYDGLLMEACMPDIIWENWIAEFMIKCSEALGYEIKSIDDEKVD